MKEETVVYRCGGCDAEFRVVSDRRPRVVCPDCKVVATPCGDREALGAYHVGYARYQEARRQIGAGLKRFAGGRLVDARALFDGASEDFEVAVEKFRVAASTADTPEIRERAERAREKATCFWQGADWLSGATYAQEDDAPDRAQHFREEAEQKLLDAREYGTVDAPEDLGAHTDADIPSTEQDESGTASDGDPQTPQEQTREGSDAEPTDLEPSGPA
jgi:hypothetical protein